MAYPHYPTAPLSRKGRSGTDQTPQSHHSDSPDSSAGSSTPSNFSLRYGAFLNNDAESRSGLHLESRHGPPSPLTGLQYSASGRDHTRLREDALQRTFLSLPDGAFEDPSVTSPSSRRHAEFHSAQTMPVDTPYSPPPSHIHGHTLPLSAAAPIQRVQSSGNIVSGQLHGSISSVVGRFENVHISANADRSQSSSRYSHVGVNATTSVMERPWTDGPYAPPTTVRGTFGLDHGETFASGSNSEPNDPNQWKEYAHAIKADPTIYRCVWRTMEDGVCNYEAKKHLVKRHVEATHLKIKKFACPHCGAAFPQKGSLDVHINRHTGEKPYGCKYNCGEFFNDPARRHRHMVEMHGYTPGQKSKTGRHSTSPFE